MAVRASFITKPCELALRGTLCRDQGLWAQAGAFLRGLERAVGSCNPGVVVDGDSLLS